MFLHWFYHPTILTHDKERANLSELVTWTRLGSHVLCNATRITYGIFIDISVQPK